MSKFKDFLNSIFKEDIYKNYNNIFEDNIENLPKDSEYYISPYHAFQIADKPCNLKSDFCRRYNYSYSYLDFVNCNIELVDADNQRKYWLVSITAAKQSKITVTEDTTIFSDGILLKDDLKKLQCLIDVNTGEYFYYPEEDQNI